MTARLKITILGEKSAIVFISCPDFCYVYLINGEAEHMVNARVLAGI